MAAVHKHLFISYCWQWLLHRSCFSIQSSCCSGSFYCCNYYFSNYSFWKGCSLIDEGIKNRDEKSCLAHKNGDYSNLYGGFWLYYSPVLIFLGARISSKLVNKINFRITIK